MSMDARENAGRVRNTKRNIIYALLQFVVSRILPFIVRTILIYRFGVEYLGLSSLFSSILSVLSLMELGFGTAVVYSMYKPIAEGDTAQISAHLAYYRKIYRYVGIAILIAGIALMPFLKWLIRDPELPGHLNIYACYLIFLGDAVISYLLYGYLTAIPTAYQRRDILSQIDMGVQVFSCALRCLVLLTAQSFYYYLFAFPVITIIRNLLTAVVIRRKFPEIVCRGELSLEQKLDLRRNVSGILINKMTNVSRNSIDSLCISAFIGLVMTGIYSNYYFVMSSVLSCGIMVCQSMLASVGNSIAVESVGKNYDDMRKFNFIFMGIVSWATVCMLCLYQPFIKLWVTEKMMLGIPVVIGFCAYYYIMETGAIQWLYHQGVGLWYESRYIMIGEAVSNIVLNIILCKLLGVFGIVLATVLSVFVTNGILCPRLLFRLYFKNGKLKEYWSDHACYAGTMVITAGISWCICEKLFPMNMVGVRFMSSILCLGGRLIVCCFVAVGLFWLIWHKNVRYKEAVGWMKKILMV